MSNIVNVAQSLQQISLIPSASYTADGNGTGVDISDYVGDMAFLLDCGAATAGSSPTMDIKLQESDDDSTYTDVASGAFTQVTSTASRQKIVKNTDGLKKYVRAVRDIGGTSSPAFPISLQAVGLKKYPA